MEKKHKRTLTIIIVVASFLLITAIFAGILIFGGSLRYSPNTISKGVLYLNYEEIYVYDSLESALTDTKSKDGPPRPLKEFLPDLLAKEKLVYLEGTTVGICIDTKITEKEIPYLEGKSDRTVYKLDNYFIAKCVPGE